MAHDTLTYVKTRNPVKVFVVFALGILLPNLVLGYLGVRAYRYENRLMRKESEERFTVVANLIESTITTRISTWIGALRTMAAQPNFQRLDYGQLMPHLLVRSKLDTFAINGLFIFDDQERMVAPWPAESRRTPPVSQKRDVDWGPLTEDIERLEKLEFADKNIKAALQGYMALQAQRHSAIIHAALLKTIAGIHRKLKHPHLAAATYMTLATDDEQLEDFSGLPMGVLGRQLALELYEQENSWKNVLDIRMDLFEGLLLHRWNLTEKQSSDLLAEERDAIRRTLTRKSIEVPGRKTRWENLLAMQDQLVSQAHAGQRFAKEEWPDLLRRIRRLGRLDQGAVLEMPLAKPPKIAIVVPILVPQTDHRKGILITILSAENVWTAMDETMVTLTQPTGLRALWAHGTTPPSKSRLWKTPFERAVSSMDPPLRFQLVESDTSAREDAFVRRQRIFGAIISLSFVVLLMGLLITFQAVKRETELANLKSDFVAMVSHELRTPLAAISHIGDMLSMGRYRSEDERKEFYGLLGRETTRLRHLIEDILDFSKMLAGKKVYRQEPLNLVDLVDDSIDAFESKADSRGFSISQDLPSHPITIRGDARAIKQTIINLLDNAMKYSAESRTIGIRVTQSSSFGIVAVSDQGVGIAERDKDKIFEKFYRVERGTQGQTEGGVGLGLAMVKHVIEGHRGKIEVVSQLGKGSTFSLIFPLPQGGLK